MNNTIKRTIMIFPKFNNNDILDEIRRKYDPLVNKVNPHITLVFPFDSDITTPDLKNHLEDVLANYKPFNLVMKNITKINNELGMYFFLEVNEGINNIKEISDKLYSSILLNYKPVWLTNESFIPHMTLGSFDLKEDLENAFIDVSNIHETFETLVNTISVEIIDEIENSIIEIEVKLKKTL